MKLSLIAALGKKNELGLDGKMPWDLPEDLKYFKKTTMNHHLLMGRKTYESIGFPLPGRKTVVLSKNCELKIDKVDVFTLVDDALKLATSRGEEEFFFAGGATIYEIGLRLANRLYLTRVDYEGRADTYFPEIDFSKFLLISSDEGSGCTFEVWDRI